LVRQQESKTQELLSVLQNAEEAAKEQLTTLNGIKNLDPCPRTFVGVVEGYRFTTGVKGQQPSHRFELQCGNGLKLHIETKPEQFGALMIDMDMGEIKPSKINGKLVIVARSPGVLVPTEMIAAEPIPNKRDRWGNYLWVGAYVDYNGGTYVVGGDVKGDSELGNGQVFLQDYGAGSTRSMRLVL
jgi:hypothetical protein